MTFKSLLSKGILGLKAALAALSKGILDGRPSESKEIKSDAMISGGVSLPTGGRKRSTKKPYWAPTKKPIKLKIRTRGIKRYNYTWQAQIKAVARSLTQTRLHTHGIKRFTTGLLAQIKGTRSFKVAYRVTVVGIKLFVAILYVRTEAIRRTSALYYAGIKGIIRKSVLLSIGAKGIKSIGFGASWVVTGIKSIEFKSRLVVRGLILGITTKIYKVIGKRNLAKIFFVLRLFDKKKKR